MTAVSAPRFVLPEERVAASPPEARGMDRDETGLLVARPQSVEHARFRDLADWLAPGDVVVVNTSPTMPAAIAGALGDRSVDVHLSTQLDDDSWVVELRRLDRSGPVLDGRPGDTVQLDLGSITLIEPVDHRLDGVRLWRAGVDIPGGVRRFIRRHGRPIRYGYVRNAWPLSMYQTVFADQSQWPGSAEMPSAGRPFTKPLLARLRTAGVHVVPIQLHTGVSSQEAGETPQPERYEVPASTAKTVNAAKAAGRRVVAVGTTVTRALETVGDANGRVRPGAGWTDLVLRPDRRAQVVDGLVTGWHPPEASHLDLLVAVAGPELVDAAYAAALDAGYLWHEFGDSCLLLPG